MSLIMSGEPIAPLSSYSLVIILTNPHAPAHDIKSIPSFNHNSSNCGVLAFDKWSHDLNGFTLKTDEPFIYGNPFLT